MIQQIVEQIVDAPTTKIGISNALGASPVFGGCSCQGMAHDACMIKRNEIGSTRCGAFSGGGTDRLQVGY